MIYLPLTCVWFSGQKQGSITIFLFVHLFDYANTTDCIFILIIKKMDFGET